MRSGVPATRSGSCGHNDAFLAKMLDPFLQIPLPPSADVLLKRLHERFEEIRSIRDLIVHFPRDRVAGLAEVGDDRVRSKLFRAVPVESEPPTAARGNQSLKASMGLHIRKWESRRSRNDSKQSEDVANHNPSRIEME